MGSLYQYLAGFFTSITPFSEEMAIRNSSSDVHKTLIQAFYDGISPKSFTKKLEETSCSTWPAALQKFQDCLTPTSVQLAVGQRAGRTITVIIRKRNLTKRERKASHLQLARNRKGPQPIQGPHSHLIPRKSPRQKEDIGANTFRNNSKDRCPLQKLSA